MPCREKMNEKDDVQHHLGTGTLGLQEAKKKIRQPNLKLIDGFIAGTPFPGQHPTSRILRFFIVLSSFLFFLKEFIYKA